MIYHGLLVFEDNGVFTSSIEVQQKIQQRFPDFSTPLDDYTQFLPAITVYGLDLAGVKAKHNFWDRSVMLVSSVALMGVTVYSMKYLTHVERPDGSSYTALPSGHTAMAFATATFMHKEYGQRSIWYSVGAYSCAALTGALRMLNNRHWLSDVLVGAGIGILSTELVYYFYAQTKKKIVNKRKAKKADISLLPVYDGKFAGGTLVVRF